MREQRDMEEKARTAVGGNLSVEGDNCDHLHEQIFKIYNSRLAGAIRKPQYDL